jgi:hypothetical protein
MANATDNPGKADMEALRAGIKRRYAAYHTLNRDTYPLLDFNSNRANYQPLRDSFETEFFSVRKLDRADNHLHIPSLDTFARFFSDPDYVPSRKILNTCRSYAEGAAPLMAPPPTVSASMSSPATTRPRTQRVGIGAVALVVLLLAGATAYWHFGKPASNTRPSGLVILSPHDGAVIHSQRQYVAGKVANADMVWVVVHPVGKDQLYYVQDAIRVAKDGTWKSLIYIGRPDSSSDGFTFEIRAFVRPGGSYTAIGTKKQYEYTTWPETAELASAPIRVMRGPTKK